MLVIHATRALRDRLPGPDAAPDDTSTTTLGLWYATLLRWRRPGVLLVNQTTLLPLFMRLAPATTLLERIPDATSELLLAHHVPGGFVTAEHSAMTQAVLAPTANRSIVGVLIEITRLADYHRTDPATDENDLLDLSLRLARTPLGPLYRRHVSPDRELAALLTQQQPPQPREPQ